MERSDPFVRVFQFRKCSIGESLKIPESDSPLDQPVAEALEKKDPAVGGGAISRAGTAIALERDEGAERGG